MQKIKSLLVVASLALFAACSPKYIEPAIVAQKTETEKPIVRLRSQASIDDTKEPLIVLDGKIVERTILNDMDPNDIASITVLKDASAAAIYGTRGKNGVVIITLKK